MKIASIVLRINDDGSALTIGDLAQIDQQGIDRVDAYFVDDNPAMTLRVDRSDQGDAIDIQAVVQQVADEMQATLPDGVEIDLIRARAEYITGRLNLLLDNGLVGLALVVTLLFLFLNARTAFWVAAGISCRNAQCDCVDVCGRADNQHDLSVCFDHHTRDCCGRCYCCGGTR